MDAAAWDVDLSSHFHLAYSLAADQSVKDLGGETPKDKLIVEDLHCLIPQLDNQLMRRLTRDVTCDVETDTERVLYHLLFDADYGFTFYDLGPLQGERCKRIVPGFNALNPRQPINDIVLVDRSFPLLDQAFRNLARSLAKPISIEKKQADFREFEIHPVYRACSPRLEKCRLTGRSYDATCQTNLERKVLFLGGNTLNNFANPVQLLWHLGKSMNYLDLMVAELRHVPDYTDYPSVPRQFVYAYLKGLGFSEEYTTDLSGKSTVHAINNSSRSYGFVLTQQFTVLENHLLVGVHPSFIPGVVFEKGKSFLAGFSKPIALDRLIGPKSSLNHYSFTEQDDTAGKLAVIAYRNLGRDAILYLTKAPHRDVPYTFPKENVA